MRPLRVVALGVAGLLVAASLAMGALSLVRADLDEPSAADVFPALAPMTESPPPSTVTPEAPTPTGGPDATPTRSSASPSTSRPASPTGPGDDGHDGSGGDDD